MSTRGPTWTRERIVAALIRGAAQLRRIPSGRDWRWASDDHPNASAVYQRFGSWPAALRAAGLTAHDDPPSPELRAVLTAQGVEDVEGWLANTRAQL